MIYGHIRQRALCPIRIDADIARPWKHVFDVSTHRTRGLEFRETGDQATSELRDGQSPN